MYVCVCKAVSDKTIRQKVGEGLGSMRELKQCLGVGSQCGKCTQTAQQVLNQSLQDLYGSNRIPCHLVDERPAA
jgi:bacterioferritin-associated ferredoxin